MTNTARVVAATLLLVVPHFALLFAYALLKPWALYSEEDVLNANVLHTLFSTGKHFAEDFWQPDSMTQRDRLKAIGEALHASKSALSLVGIDVFLESSSLIGWLRHGGHIPWETDADLGMLAADCYRFNVTRQAVEWAAGNTSEDLVVLKFACHCEEDCEGEDKRLAGKFTDRKTGVTVDIFGYAPVAKLRSWQKASQYTDWNWLERVDDHADYTFPDSALLPLQQGEFLGSPMMLPRDPHEFLSWEYGGCLGCHIWPWRLLLYTPASKFTPFVVLLKSISPAFLSDSQWAPNFSAIAVVLTAGVLGALQSGVALSFMLATCVCELTAVLLWAGLLGSEARQTYLALLFCTMALLVFDMRGVFAQLWCSVDDFYIHPRRPKTWTLCLLGKCWDF